MRSVNQEIKPKTLKVNQSGNLEIGGCDMVELVKKYGTPLYVMCEDTLRTMARQYKQAFSSYPKVKMTYASKALMTSAIAKILASEDFGFDAVSGGEIFTIKNSGADISTITFNGSNKSADELNMALDLHVGRISVDNFLELEMLNSLASEKNIVQKIMLRITPGIECHTHEYIQTGHLDSKFGFDLVQVDCAIEAIKRMENLKLVGLHAHIGSQIFETEVYKDEIAVLIKEMERIKSAHGIELTEMNIGGGLGITYTDADCPPSVFETAAVIIKAIEENCNKYSFPLPELYIEPGRSLVGTSGITLYTVGSSKQVPNGRKYIAVDGGMADNPRPSMYEAEYFAQIANAKPQAAPEKVRVAGRFCESGDILIRETELNSPAAGDVLCVYNTGAYNYSMSSNYNCVPKPAMVLVNNSQSDIIISRQSYEQLVQNDVIPSRL